MGPWDSHGGCGRRKGTLGTLGPEGKPSPLLAAPWPDSPALLSGRTSRYPEAREPELGSDGPSDSHGPRQLCDHEPGALPVPPFPPLENGEKAVSCLRGRLGIG